MMIWAVAASAVSTGWIDNDFRDVPISVYTIDMKTVSESRVIDGMTLTLPVQYRATFSSDFDEFIDVQNRPYRTLRLRPDQKSEPRDSLELRAALERVEVVQSEVNSLFTSLSEIGGRSDLGLQVNTAIDKCLDSARMETGSFEPVMINTKADLQPGGWTVRTYGHELVDFSMDYSIEAKFEYGGKTYSEAELSGSVSLGAAFAPRFSALDQYYVPDGSPEKKLQEAFGGGIFRKDGQDSTIQVQLPEYEYPSVFEDRTVGDYVADLTKANGSGLISNLQTQGYTIPELSKTLDRLAPQGTDMNRLNFGDWDDSDCEADLDFPPGTVWLPSNKGYQAMMTGVRFDYMTPGFDLLASVVGEGNQAPSMRVLCMNMNKKEPAAGIKYFPYVPKDPVIPMLAKRMDESNFRGPWDQARLWIYTDKASLDDLNKRLIQQLPISSYVMALADVDWVGGLDEKMVKDAKIVRPEFLAGNAAPAYATSFLLEALNRFHGKKAGEWLRKNPDRLVQIARTEMDDYDRAHLKLVFGRMLTFEMSEDRLAALQILSSNQKEFAFLKGGLGSGRQSLYSANRTEIEAALGLVESGMLEVAQDAMDHLSTQGPSDAIKARARALLKAN
jgi:hypothetical protein